ncbi:MAG: sugar transporter substrate-binding protein [Rhizobium sp.]|nr:sugar transporter substrate-binding protein [Rhizobium sp.]
MRGSSVTLKCSAAFIVSISLASCNTLPRSGPSHQSIDKSASSKYVSVDKKVGIDYALVDITKQVASFFDYTIINSLENGFGGGKGPPPQNPLGIGDVVEITIFEAQAGGLFIPDDAGSRPGNYITLPKQTVDRTGMISVPYAGPIRVAGRSVGDVQADIEKRLSNRAIEPQVIITTTLARSNNISVLGDVNTPAQLDLSPAGERVLDVLARSGGLNAPQYETYVTIERNGRQATVLFRTLVDKPSENIYVRPGDTIYVSRERRTYLVFGATEQAGRLDFEDSNLTLGEAIAKTGGLLDGRADPAQVFLYREVPRDTLVKMGVDVSKFNGAIIPTVFRANLRDPAIFFAIQEFKMKDKDTIYVSNADAVELTKFLALINNVSDTTANVPANALTSRTSIRRLTR